MAIAFPIKTPRDLLRKAKREIDQLEAQANAVNGEPDPTVVADLTINAAWSLWHTTDWVGFRVPAVLQEFLSPRQMKEPATERTERFQRRVRARSRDLRICWGLALRFKHFELDTEEARNMFDEDEELSAPAGYPDMSDGPASTIIPMFSVVPPPQVTVNEVNFSLQGVVSGMAHLLPRKTLHPKVTYKSAHKRLRLRLIDVYRDAYDYLDRLLKRYGL